MTATIERMRTAFREHGRDPATLGVRSNLAVKTNEDGTVDLEATVAPVPDLAARGITTVSVALGRFLRSRADVEPFFRTRGRFVAGSLRRPHFVPARAARLS